MTETVVRFETLIEHHHDEIYAYLWRLLRNAGWADASVEAEDLTQEVFLRAYRAFGRLRSDSNPRAWLYKIATNCAYTALSRGGRTASLQLNDELDKTTEALSPERQMIEQEALDRVGQAIAVLPPKQRIAVVLRYVQVLDYATIAQALECSKDSARANVYQGLRRLRRELVEELE